MTILLTGGAGYIGSHIAVELLGAGHSLVVYDNFCNSSPEALARVKALTGKDFAIETGDIRDQAALARLMRSHKIDAVIHCAGLKAVGESVIDPLLYHEVNVGGSRSLLSAMQETQVASIVFSSSATVYGEPDQLPMDEAHKLAPVNPYGATKRIVEMMLSDMEAARQPIQSAILRYFNPVGAHESGRIGEDPRGVPNNLVPFLAQVAVGKRQLFEIFGDDYPTKDGTCVRDYVHVVDLARAHVGAVQRLRASGKSLTLNLGTGRGYSVLQMLRAFEKAVGRPLDHSIAPRRAGDVAICYADPARAAAEIGWTARFDLDRMCEDHWRWQRLNPDGFASA